MDAFSSGGDVHYGVPLYAEVAMPIRMENHNATARLFQLLPGEVDYRSDQEAYRNLMNRIRRDFDQGPINDLATWNQYACLLVRMSEHRFAEDMIFILRGRLLLPAHIFPGLGIDGLHQELNTLLAQNVFHLLMYGMSIQSNIQEYAESCMTDFISKAILVMLNESDEWISLVEEWREVLVGLLGTDDPNLNKEGLRRILNLVSSEATRNSIPDRSYRRSDGDDDDFNRGARIVRAVFSA